MAPRALWTRLHKHFDRHTFLAHAAWPESAKDLLFGAALLSPLVHAPVQISRSADLQIYELFVIRICGRGGSNFDKNELAGCYRVGEVRSEQTKNLKGVDIALDVAQCTRPLHLRTECDLRRPL